VLNPIFSYHKPITNTLRDYKGDIPIWIAGLHEP